MDSQDSAPNAAEEPTKQSEDVEKHMDAERENAEASLPKPDIDRSIMATPDETSAVKPLSEIASKPNTPDPTTLVDMSSFREEKAKSIKRKNPKKIVFFCIVFAVVALIALGIWLIIVISNIDRGGAVADENMKSFFIEKAVGDGSYAVFNSDGEQLTDFDFIDYEDFYDGYAVVEKKDEGFAIITNTGKLAVPFGRYESIDQIGKYFFAKAADKAFVITGTGDTVLDANSFEEWESLFFISTDNGAIVYTRDGERLGEARDNVRNNNAVKNGYVVIAIKDNKQFIINIETGLKVTDFNSKGDCSVSSKSDSDDNVFVIICQEGSKYEKTFAYYHGKIYGWNEEKDKNLITIRNSVPFSTNDECMHVDREGNTFRMPSTNYCDSTHYSQIPYSESHYAVLDKKAHRLSIINGDQTVEVDGVGKLDESGHDGYIVFIDDGGVRVYNQAGKVTFSYPHGNIADFTDFDKNKLAIINDSREPSSILIDEDGNTIFKIKDGNISHLYKDKYLVSTGSGMSKKIYVIDKLGKKMIDEEQNYTNVNVVNGFFVFARKDGSLDLYDKNMKTIISDYELITVEKSHIVAIKNQKKKYFTFSGQKFYGD